MAERERVGYFIFALLLPQILVNGQFSKPGADLKPAGPDVFKSPPTCTI